MSEISDVIRAITKGLDVYRRGIVCPAVFWEIVTRGLTTYDVADILDSLSEEEQSEIRAIREERPWSLRSDLQDDPVRQQVERWCIGGDTTR